MSVVAIATNKAPAAVGAYSQATAIGDYYFFSGMLGINPQNGEIAQDFDNQLKQVLSNIDGLLDHLNISRSQIVKTTIFMKDLRDFAKVNQAYTEYFPQPFPARSCVEVSRLPKDALIEIEVIATKIK